MNTCPGTTDWVQVWLATDLDGYSAPTPKGRYLAGIKSICIGFETDAPNAGADGCNKAHDRSTVFS